MPVNPVSYISTMVCGQAVHESFIVVEALAVWTEGVKLGCMEKIRQSLINGTKVIQ